jgi:hypothetical protein
MIPPLHKRRHESIGANLDHFAIGCTKQFRIGSSGQCIINHAIYAPHVSIPCKTFYKYIHPDEKKRLLLGDGSCGKTKLLTNNKVKFTGAILARQDHANDGLSRKEAKDVIMDLNTNLS